MLRRRSSAGSIFISSAAMSMSRSIMNDASGLPAPRYGEVQ